MIIYCGVGSTGLPRVTRTYSEPSALKVHEEVALRTRPSVAVAITACRKLLRSSNGLRKLVIIVDDLKCVDIQSDFVESSCAVVNRLVMRALPIFTSRHVGRPFAVEQRVVFLVSLAQRYIFDRIVGIHVVTINFDFTPSNIDFVFAIGPRPLVVLDAFARTYSEMCEMKVEKVKKCDESFDLQFGGAEQG